MNFSVRPSHIFSKLTISVLCITLFCSGKRIEVMSNFTSDPNDQQVINSFLGPTQSLLQKEGIQVVASDLLHDLTTDDILKVVVWNQPIAEEGKKPLKTKRIPKDKAVLFLWEPPHIFPRIYEKRNLKNFKKIYTWDDTLVDNKTFFKFYYPVLRPMREDVISFQEKKLLAFVFSRGQPENPDETNLYPERERLVQFFETKPEGEFACYGRGWQNYGYKNYQGVTPNKIETISHFRFTLSYENSINPGYVTEKIFDAFHAGSVPVYLGAPNIEKYIPKHCFIDRRDFASNEELYLFLKQMDEKEYNQYLENIRSFLKSDKAALFSMDKFQQIFQESIR